MDVPQLGLMGLWMGVWQFISLPKIPMAIGYVLVYVAFMVFDNSPVCNWVLMLPFGVN